MDIRRVKIDPKQDHADELIALQKDAIRLQSQFERLCRLNESRAESYYGQFEEALAEVELKAEELYEL